MLYSTDQFHYNAKTKTFLAEASSLGRGVTDPLFGPDGIIMLQSHKTGKTAEFEVRSTRTSDSDVLDWVLHPTEAAAKANPSVRYLRVVIFND